MTPLPNIPASLIPALRIFEKELQSFVEFLESFDKATLLSKLHDGEFRTNLSHRLHTIRGGAGFFALDEIQQSAGKAEKLLQGELTETVDFAAEVILSSLAVIKRDLVTLSAITG